MGGGHFDQLGDEGQGVGRQAQLLGQLGAELGEVRWQIRARPLAHGGDFVRLLRQRGVRVPLLRPGVSQRLLQRGRLVLQLRQRGRGLGLQLCQLRSAKGLGDG